MGELKRRVLVAALALVSVSLQAACFAATKPILLVTPSGVWRAEVVDGVPGPWVPQDIDVIVQGFSTGPDDPDPPKPPPDTDPVVGRVATLSKAALQTETNGRAAAALVETLGKEGLTGKPFVEALHLTAPIMDTQLGAKGKISGWAKQVTDITADPDKISAGVRQAFALSATELAAIEQASRNPTDDIGEAALDFAAIIKIIQMILDLLRNLGIL